MRLVFLARIRVTLGHHHLFHQELEEPQLTGLSGSGQEELSHAACHTNVHFTQTIEALLMLVIDGKGARAGDTVHEAQDPGHRP